MKNKGKRYNKMAAGAGKEKKWDDPEIRQQCLGHCYVGEGNHHQQSQLSSAGYNHGRRGRDISIKPTINLLYMNEQSIVNKM